MLAGYSRNCHDQGDDGRAGFVEKGQMDNPHPHCRRGLLNRMRCDSAEALTHICNANYWSSTENNATNAWNFNFNNGNTNNNNKTNTLSVRAVRDSSAKLTRCLKFRISGIIF